MTWKRTPQGYVITTATITRAGPIEYYGHEIGLTGSDASKKITVIRTLDQLSKPETLASFNGLPFTITHPDDGEVTAEDHKDKAVGHIANTRIKGSEVVCDIYLTDAAAIKTLERTGIREVSVGYEPATLIERGGSLYHINIRGNHVAGVAKGRYGADVRLNDKEGKSMKNKLKDIVRVLKGKNLRDADGEKLTQEDIDQMIASLEAQLEEMKAAGVEGVSDSMQDIIDELERLRKEKEAAGPTDEEPESAGDDKDAQLAALRTENGQLKAENQQLKEKVAELEEKLEQLQAEKEAGSTLNDAKVRFPKVNFNDAKSARDIRAAVLTSTRAFNDAQVKAMTDSEVRAAYAAIQATSKPRSEIGAHLFNDSKPATTKTANQRLGGK